MSAIRIELTVACSFERVALVAVLDFTPGREQDVRGSEEGEGRRPRRKRSRNYV